MSVRIVILLFWVLLTAFTQAGAATPTGEQLLKGTTTELLGAELAKEYASTIPENYEVEWEIFVPSSYTEDEPPGVLVYISPTPSGKIPSGWKRIMEEHNIIWISARKSGNTVSLARRSLYTILGLGALQKDYKIDADRVYVSGYSGGGRAASIVVTTFPNVFSGAIYICGVNRWEVDDPTLISQIQSNRYVFVTGHRDFNRRETKRIFTWYQREGAENVKLMDLSYLTHSLPRAPELEEAIVFLDGDQD
jgi:predicted esterase